MQLWIVSRQLTAPTHTNRQHFTCRRQVERPVLAGIAWGQAHDTTLLSWRTRGCLERLPNPAKATLVAVLCDIQQSRGVPRQLLMWSMQGGTPAPTLAAHEAGHSCPALLLSPCHPYPQPAMSTGSVV